MLGFYSTYLKDCPCHIKLRTSADGKKLVIKSQCLEHNHERTEVSSELPKN
jgi:hypothetical protein